MLLEPAPDTPPPQAVFAPKKPDGGVFLPIHPAICFNTSVLSGAENHGQHFKAAGCKNFDFSGFASVPDMQSGSRFQKLEGAGSAAYLITNERLLPRHHIQLLAAHDAASKLLQCTKDGQHTLISGEKIIMQSNSTWEAARPQEIFSFRYAHGPGNPRRHPSCIKSHKRVYCTSQAQQISPLFMNFER
jgi:hypothetical protein